jgi:CubicO group peptidase (beta-lactamase class C family)
MGITLLPKLATAQQLSPKQPLILSQSQIPPNYDAALKYSNDRQGEALVIVRDGKTELESYNNYDPTKPHRLASGTKSFNCAFQILAEKKDGFQELGLNKLASDILTEWKSDTDKKAQITILDLLTLSSGLKDSDKFDNNNLEKIDTYDLSLNDTMFVPGAEELPRTVFFYGASNFQNFANIFERRTGTDPVAYLQSRLFTPLGIDVKNVGWDRDKLMNPQMAGGAYLLAKDWAKYGQLFLQNGQWNGTQLLDANAVKNCLTYNNTAFRGYGITWWLNKDYTGTYDDRVDNVPEDGLGVGPRFAPSAPPDTYMAAGTGVQRLYVIPSKQLVIVRFGSTDPTSNWSDDEFLSIILGTSAL